MKKIISMIICILLIASSFNVFADNIKLSKDNIEMEYLYSQNKVIVKGSMENDDLVTLQILNKDVTYKNYVQNNCKDSDVLYRNQQTVENEMFVFEIEYPYETISGNYNGKIANFDGEIIEFTIPIISSKDYIDEIDKLNSLANSLNYEEFEKEIKEKYQTLGFDLTYADLSSDSNNFANLCDYIKANPFDSNNEESNLDVFNSHILLNAVKSKRIKNIKDYFAKTSLAKTDAYKYYKENVLTEAEQEYLTGKLSSFGNVLMKDLEKTFIESLLLEQVRYATGADDLRKTFTKFGYIANVNGNEADSVYKSLSGKEYSNAESLYSAFKNYSDESKAEKKTGSSGGGGSSSSSKQQYVLDATSTNASFDKTTKKEFTDIDSVPWATTAITCLYDKGIINGKEEGIFKPNDNIKREEFVKILIGALNVEKLEEGNVFSDVNNNDWFVKYVNTANKLGVVKGIGDNKFGVGNNITRQDLCVMIYNALKSKNITLNTNKSEFEDYNSISDYAKDAVNALYNLKVVNGVSETEFQPLGNATRAQAAKIIYGVLEYLQ